MSKMSQFNEKRNGRISLVSSWDDWCPENIRLANLLKEYGIYGIFFAEASNKSHRGGDGIAQAKELADMGFEIGSHTISHPLDMKLLSDEELEKEIINSRIILQKETGQEINWFCYPSGKFDERVKGFVKKAGYKFARTTNLGMRWDNDPYAVYTDFHCYPRRKEYKGRDWFDYGKEIIEAKVNSFKSPEIHFWGHGHELTKYQDSHQSWDKLESLLKWLKKEVLK